jgi:predicted  nucleic acid-binding Zn-ribbon protein
MLEQCRALTEAEHLLGEEVAAVAARAKDVETTLYSGTVRASKELTALQEEIRLHGVRQSELESRELDLLEEIDRADRAIAENRAAQARTHAELALLADALALAEQAIDAELAKLELARHGLLASIPSEIVVTYERLRTRERLLGRAAAALVEGSCGGCRMKLPVLEYNRMKSKPEDALLLCVHCGRILIR